MFQLKQHTGLYTDFYELVMAQGYYLSGRQNEYATFDYFFRSNPFNGGYTIFAGLSDMLEAIQTFTYSSDSIAYLKKNGFDKEFLDYLSSFRFNGTIYSVQEGEIVFPNEPIIKVEGTLIETQLIETLLLNIINFQSLIATKASRIKSVAGNKTVIDFGLRRAQGLGGIHASKAAVQGGVDATSNVFAGMHYDLNISGTQAHSWIQSFDNEYEAFLSFANNFSGKIILLVDTYDTLKSGVPNVIKLAHALRKEGEKIHGIRIDSGDLYYFSKKARNMLDQAGFEEIKIFASNELDEYVIKSLIEQGAPIDGYGVGTRLITGTDDAALDGIYKLSSCNDEPRLKISENIEKTTLPGKKKIIRLIDNEGSFYGDAVALENETLLSEMYHPVFPDKHTEIGCYVNELLTEKVMDKGKKTITGLLPEKCKHYTQKRLSKLPKEFKRFKNPHIYKVGITKNLLKLKQELTNSLRQSFKNK
jgi:nicotinate phosphoribosyltransferase